MCIYGYFSSSSVDLWFVGLLLFCSVRCPVRAAMGFGVFGEGGDDEGNGSSSSSSSSYAESVKVKFKAMDGPRTSNLFTRYCQRRFLQYMIGDAGIENKRGGVSITGGSMVCVLF